MQRRRILRRAAAARAAALWFQKPLADAKVAASGAVSVVYTRNYANCEVAVVCPAGAGGGDCDASLRMKP